MLPCKKMRHDSHERIIIWVKMEMKQNWASGRTNKEDILSFIGVDKILILFFPPAGDLNQTEMKLTHATPSQHRRCESWGEIMPFRKAAFVFKLLWRMDGIQLDTFSSQVHCFNTGACSSNNIYRILWCAQAGKGKFAFLCTFSQSVKIAAPGLAVFVVSIRRLPLECVCASTHRRPGSILWWCCWFVRLNQTRCGWSVGMRNQLNLSILCGSNNPEPSSVIKQLVRTHPAHYRSQHDDNI